MKTSAEHAIETESAYLAGVKPKLAAAGSRFIAGKWFESQEHDRAERVKEEMADRRIYDRKRFSELPHGKTITVKGFERRWIFGRRLRSATVATVIAPPGPLLESDESAPPVSLAELTAHVRSLVVNDKAPHLIGVCSPSGFEDDAWNARLEMSNVKLVLVTPRDGGGWKVKSTDAMLDERLWRLFDPEDAGQKIDRVMNAIRQQRTALLTGGLTARSMADRLGLPEFVVNEAFARAAKTDPELRLSKSGGEVMLYRGASAMPEVEEQSMSLADWIKSLFSKEGDEAKKINVLSERRAALSGRLDRLYEDIGTLEKKEAELLQEGKASDSKVAMRRLAAQVAQLRKDISRLNTSAALLSKQINVISTHIHNLELAKTGSAAQLPSSEELTEAAVNAEEMLEQTSASADLVNSLEVTMAESAMSDDEAAIFAEFEKGEEKPAEGEPREAADSGPSAETESQRRERGEAQAE